MSGILAGLVVLHDHEPHASLVATVASIVGIAALAALWVAYRWWIHRKRRQQHAG